MRPGKPRKDRPKAKVREEKRGGGSKSARPGSGKKDRDIARKPNFREERRDNRRPDRPEKRFDRKQSAQDAVAGKNSVVEALRAKIPAKELVVAINNFIGHSLGHGIT